VSGAQRQPLTDAEREVLAELEWAGSSSQRDYRNGWCRPLDFGGRDWSRHSRTLRKLVRHGLVATRQRGSLSCPEGRTGSDAWEKTKPARGWRGSRLYRITDDGKATLARTKARA
jgi:hypothetical protein